MRYAQLLIKINVNNAVIMKFKKKQVTTEKDEIVLLVKLRRKVPFALKNTLKDKLDKLENKAVISKVEGSMH